MTNENTNNELLEAALNYAAKGWAVFPLIARGKLPLTKHGFLDATKDAKIINTWWEQWPNANVGIATGAFSGMFVLDVDAKYNGYEALKALGELPVTLTVKTGGGGLHLYFNKPDFQVSNTVQKLGEGLDIRGTGGYVVAPPSLHGSGQRYVWADETTPIADAPSHLLKKIKGKPKPNKPGEELQISEGSRNDGLFKQAVKLRKAGFNKATLKTTIETLNREQCDPPLDAKEVESIVERVADYEVGPSNDAIIFNGKLTTATDVGNARLLIKKFGDIIRYCSDRGQWYVWNNKYWQEDTGDLAVKRLFITAIDNMQEEDFYGSGNPEKLLEELKKHRKNSSNSARINAAVEVAKVFENVTIKYKQLDNNILLLNLANGTFDFATYELREFRKEDYLTKCLDYNYNPAATAPIFEKFISELMLEDSSLINYIQRFMGYCLTGETVEESLFLCYGNGANGKSTFVELLKILLGSYAHTAQFTSFVATRSERIRNDIASMAGARLVSAAEVSDEQQLDEAVIKNLTGADTVKARFLFKEGFEFVPTFKIILSVNRLPVIKGTDDGIWRRIKIIPFDATFPPGKKDFHMSKKLRNELSGIFNWALTGYKSWKQLGGLKEPQKVLDAVKAYRDGSDTLERFITSACRQGNDLQVVTAVFHKDYEEWCKSELIINKLNASQIISSMKFRGFRLKKVKGTFMYEGIDSTGWLEPIPY